MKVSSTTDHRRVIGRILGVAGGQRSGQGGTDRNRQERTGTDGSEQRGGGMARDSRAREDSRNRDDRLVSYSYRAQAARGKGKPLIRC